MHTGILGLGASTIDILSLVTHLPAADENLQASAITVQGGGPVATALVTAAHLGARCAMLDTLGDDWRGRLIHEEFERAGVDVSHTLSRAGWTSPMSCILVKQDDGARSIIWSPGSAPDFPAEQLPVEAIRAASILHVNGRHWEACMQAVRVARQAGVQVSFDGGAGRYRAELDELLPLTDICIVAREFAERCTREVDMQAAAHRLLEIGPRLVVITDGVRGSWVQPRGGASFHQPAYLMPRVVDTTGCGDSYHGAFLFGMLQDLPLESVAALASAVAAMNTQQLGGRAALPTYDAVQAFLRERGEA